MDDPPGPTSSDIIIYPSILPRNLETFFDNWPHAKPLPSPAQVRSSTFDFPFQILHERNYGQHSQRVLHFAELGLVIKHGLRTTVAEGIALWMLGKYCPEVRAPTVYGWSQDGNETIIYLSYIDGVPLQSRLDTLSDAELKEIAGQIAPMITSMRRFRQPDQDPTIRVQSESAVWVKHRYHSS